MRSKAIFCQFAYSPCPNLTPVSGVFLTLICLLLFINYPPEPERGLVLLKETLYATGNGCFNAHITTETIISLAVDGQVSFAIIDTALQAAVFRKIGKTHGITFPASHPDALGTLPYLATAIDELPGVLIHSLTAYQALLLAQRNAALTSLQLAECVATTKMLAPSLTGYPTSFFLAISAKTDASKVLKLMDALQGQGVNRFYLIAHGN